MVLFPEAQRKAQEELDGVLGQDRLPLFSDRPNLPYLDALHKEVFRWYPTVISGKPYDMNTFIDSTFQQVWLIAALLRIFTTIIEFLPTQLSYLIHGNTYFQFFFNFAWGDILY